MIVLFIVLVTFCTVLLQKRMPALQNLKHLIFAN